MKKCFLLLTGILVFNCLFSEITEKDILLNQHIKQYRPIYCTQKRVPITHWKSKYEFIIELVHAQPADPKPPSDIKNTFLGYRNKDTKVKILCNRLDPSSGNILATYDLGIFTVNELSKHIPFTIPDARMNSKVDIQLSIKRDKLDIEVIDSGKFLGMFKQYAPSTVYNIDFNVTPHTRQRT